MKINSELLKNISLVSQMGLSLLMPLLLCLLACRWLNMHLGVGIWVYVPGFILGLGSSGMTAWKIYRSVVKKEEKKKDVPAAFNRHV